MKSVPLTPTIAFTVRILVSLDKFLFTFAKSRPVKLKLRFIFLASPTSLTFSSNFISEFGAKNISSPPNNSIFILPFFLVWIMSLSLIIILVLGIGLGLLSLYKTPEPSISVRLPVII